MKNYFALIGAGAMASSILLLFDEHRWWVFALAWVTMGMTAAVLKKESE